MTKANRWSKFLLSFVGLIASGCQNIPANTAVLLQRNNERLNNQTEVTRHSFQYVVDECGLAKLDVADARKNLEGVDLSALPGDEQKQILNIIAALKEVENALTLDSRITSRPGKFAAAASEMVGVYQLVASIIAERVNQQQLISELIDTIARKEEEK